MTKQVLFFLSPRLLDFDTYLPVAMAIHRLRPDWQIRFITFDQVNARVIADNSTLMAALQGCATLHCFDPAGPASPCQTGRRWQRLRRKATYFLQICRWIAGRDGAIQFSGRPFDRGPYALWYLLGRLRGGQGYVLAKTRQTDDNINISLLATIRRRKQGYVSRIARLFGRDLDGYIHYHQNQDAYLQSIDRHGTIPPERELVIGMPNFSDAWMDFIAAETRSARQALEAQGPPSQTIYTMLPAKFQSAYAMHSAESPQESLLLVLRTVRRLRPDALILLRPHPVHLRDSRLNDLLAALNDPLVQVSFLHPEVLIGLSQRVLLNGWTNIQTTSPEGLFIDCTDYSDAYYAERGQVSMVDGYGSIHISPRSETFENQLAAALDDDALFHAPGMMDKRAALRAAGAFQPEKLLAWLEHGPQG